MANQYANGGYALYPVPDGTIVRIVDPHAKTYRFELHTDQGSFPCSAPEGYVAERGWHETY